MELMKSLRLSARSLLRQPGFAVVATLTLALGIGATTAVFSLVHAVLLRPLPFSDPDRIVRIYSVDQETGETGDNSAPDLVDLREQSRTFEAFGSYHAWNTQITGSGPAESAYIAWVTPDFFNVFGVPPLVGRTFLPQEDVPGGDVFKVVLSYGLWKNRYAQDPDILGKKLRLRQTTYEVIGVMPPGFRFPKRTDLWAPHQSLYDADGSDRRMKYRGRRFLPVVGRLAPGVSLDQASDDLRSVGAVLAKTYPGTNEDVSFRAEPLQQVETGALRPYVLALAGAVGFVLLICCVNVANLMLARALGRDQEMSLRAVLGAGRSRLAMIALADGLLLAGAGSVLGIAFAWYAIRVFPRMVPSGLLPFWLHVDLDSRVLLFAVGVTGLCALLCGIVPALRVRRSNLASLIHKGGKGIHGGGAVARFRDALVVAEIALAVLLLVGAGLMIRSFLGLHGVDKGFDARNAVTAFVSPYRPSASHDEEVRTYSSYYERVIEHLRSLPGVTAVGGSHVLPYVGWDGYGGTEGQRESTVLTARGASSDQPTEKKVQTALFLVGPGYFKAMGLPLRQGRAFRTSDDLSGEPVVIVSRRTAERFWPGRDAVGQMLKRGDVGSRHPWRRVVGVVGDVKTYASEGDGGLELYLPYTQEYAGFLHFVVRLDRHVEGTRTAVRRTIESVDPDTAVVDVKSLEEVVDDSLWQRRLWGVMFGFFAIGAVLLAAVGIYGIMSYNVHQRRSELGLRMAIGARPGEVLQSVFLRALRLAAVGVVLGIGGALVLSRIIESLLFGVSATDPVVFLAVSGLLVIVAMIAGLVPARRAARVDPIIALRGQ